MIAQRIEHVNVILVFSIYGLAVYTEIVLVGLVLRNIQQLRQIPADGGAKIHAGGIQFFGRRTVFEIIGKGFVHQVLHMVIYNLDGAFRGIAVLVDTA